jgi:hypothetical protein
MTAYRTFAGPKVTYLKSFEELAKLINTLLLKNKEAHDLSFFYDFNETNLSPKERSRQLSNLLLCLCEEANGVFWRVGLPYRFVAARVSTNAIILELRYPRPFWFAKICAAGVWQARQGSYFRFADKYEEQGRVLTVWAPGNHLHNFCAFVTQAFQKESQANSKIFADCA